MTRGRRKAEEMEPITDAIIERITEQRKAHSTVDVLAVSAAEIASEFGVHTQTVTRILEKLGAKFDGYKWLFKE